MRVWQGPQSIPYHVICPALEKDFSTFIVESDVADDRKSFTVKEFRILRRVAKITLLMTICAVSYKNSIIYAEVVTFEAV